MIFGSTNSKKPLEQCDACKHVQAIDEMVTKGVRMVCKDLKACFDREYESW